MTASVRYAAGSAAAVATQDSWLLAAAAPSSAVVREMWQRMAAGLTRANLLVAMAESGLVRLDAFALVLAGDDGEPGVVLVRGTAQVRVDHPAGPTVVGTTATSTWSEVTLPADATGLTLLVDDAVEADIPATAGVFPAAQLDVELSPGTPVPPADAGTAPLVAELPEPPAAPPPPPPPPPPDVTMESVVAAEEVAPAPDVAPEPVEDAGAWAGLLPVAGPVPGRVGETADPLPEPDTVEPDVELAVAEPAVAEPEPEPEPEPQVEPEIEPHVEPEVAAVAEPAPTGDDLPAWAPPAMPAWTPPGSAPAEPAEPAATEEPVPDEEPAPDGGPLALPAPDGAPLAKPVLPTEEAEEPDEVADLEPPTTEHAFEPPPPPPPPPAAWTPPGDPLPPTAPLEPVTAPETAAPVGTLVLSDGQTVELARAVVIGRSPQWDGPEERELVTVQSPFGDVSRSHVAVTVREGRAYVEDLGSTNGTLVAQPAGTEHLLAAHVPEELEPGAIVTLARDVSVTYQT